MSTGTQEGPDKSQSSMPKGMSLHRRPDLLVCEELRVVHQRGRTFANRPTRPPSRKSPLITPMSGTLFIAAIVYFRCTARLLSIGRPSRDSS